MNEFLSYITQQLSNLTIEVLLRTLVIILFMLIGVKLIKWFLRRIFTLEHIGKRRPVDATLFNFLHTAVALILYTLLFFTVASMLKLPMTGFITALGSVGLAVGLALQGGLSNLAGSVMIMLFRPFSIGDFIEANGNSGTVTNIGIFYTTIQSLDNRRIVIPNGALSGGTITNYSALPTRRVDLEFSAAYASDIDQVIGIMQRVASNHPLTLDDPAPFTRLLRQGDSALVFVLRVWCKAADYWTVYFDMNEQMKKAFDAAGVEIPFPQLDIHSK
ncbi:MAG: mechanosensitive ion channel [Clostridiaceae bacterium]|nr:mechanosensitive ion channel [Clostridiaceae bacterium]